MRRAYVLPLLFALACGAGGFAEKAQHSLATALIATNQARDVFTAYDLEHQKKLVEGAGGDMALAELRVKLYREKREPVVKAFVVAYSAIAAASTALAAARSQKEQLELTALIADAVAATVDIKTALAALFPKKEPP
jgi:hypothetical protein